MKEHSPVSKLLRGTIVIMAVSVLAKIVTFITEAILAAYLGTSWQSDAYYMVTGIQNVIYPMLSIGIWKVYLPIYKEKITLGETESADRLSDQVITVFTMVSIAVVVLLMVFSGAVVSIAAPGFEGQTKQLCAELVRISAPMYVFIIAAAVYASMLQSHDRFLGSQIREVASHIPTILTALFLFPKFGIRSLAIALVAGGILRLAVELPFVNWGYRFKPSFGKKSREFSLMMKRLPSALISAGVSRLNQLVDKVMASTLPAGAVSGLNYGSRLTNVFSGLLSNAVATAMYPQMVELISLRKTEELSRLLTRIVRIFAMVMFPVTIACILFRTELVSAVFQRGAFTEASVTLTAGVFACYSCGLFFTAVNSVLVNVFYGYGDTKTPMNVGIAHLVVNVCLNLILVRLLGINGLAAATSLSAMFVFGLRIVLIRQYAQMDWKNIVSGMIRLAGASLIACGFAKAVMSLIELNRYIELIAAALIGILVYFLELRLLKINELDDLLQLFNRRRQRSKRRER